MRVTEYESSIAAEAKLEASIEGDFDLGWVGLGWVAAQYLW